jgi:hypothetical protein
MLVGFATYSEPYGTVPSSVFLCSFLCARRSCCCALSGASCLCCFCSLQGSRSHCLLLDAPGAQRDQADCTAGMGDRLCAGRGPVEHRDRPIGSDLDSRHRAPTQRVNFILRLRLTLNSANHHPRKSTAGASCGQPCARAHCSIAKCPLILPRSIAVWSPFAFFPSSCAGCGDASLWSFTYCSLSLFSILGLCASLWLFSPCAWLCG